MMIRSLLVIVVSASAAYADTIADVRKVVDAQLATLKKDTGWESLYVAEPRSHYGRKELDGALFKADRMGPEIKSQRQKDVVVTLARDGNSAWVSFTELIKDDDGEHELHMSDVLVKTPKGWQIAATMFTEPVADAAVDAAAASGKQRSFYPLLGVDTGPDAPGTKVPTNPDKPLRELVAKLASGPLDATAAARPDLVVYGSAAGERTVGGAVLAKFWSASWAKRVKVTDVFGKLTPSKTTGWAFVNLALTKPIKGKPIAVEFRALLVFDKDDKGNWSLTHMNLATLAD